MPCRSDYLEPNQWEIELSRVYGILDELETGTLPDNYGTDTDSRVYNMSINQRVIDKKTAELCGKLSAMKPTKISKLSLEAQMWWRDHQEADRKREEAKKLAAKEKRQKKTALSKLSARERKLLNL